MTIDELNGSLVAHEERMKKRQQQPVDQALQAKSSFHHKENDKGSRGHGRGRGRGQGRGEGREQSENKERNANNNSRGRGRGRGRGGRSNRYNINCYNCGKYGHYISECYVEKKVEENANLATKEETEANDVVLLANKQIGPEKENVWYLDTGASNYMCGYKHMFTELKEVADGHVSFGDDSKVCIEGEGNILIKSKDGSQKFISSMYYVPEMKCNILSLGQLSEYGYTVYMKDRSLYLRDKDNRLITQVEMATNRMFKLNLVNIDATCLKTCVEEKECLWHFRFGQVNFRRLKEMASKKMVHGLPMCCPVRYRLLNT